MNFDKTGNEGKPVITRYELKDGKVYVDATVKKPTAGHGHFRKKFAELPASSTVNVGSEEKLEIVLSLDTTFSMTKSSGTSSDKLDPSGEYSPSSPSDIDRLTALKNRGPEVQQRDFWCCHATSSPRISVVPFSRYVNVGVSGAMRHG